MLEELDHNWKNGTYIKSEILLESVQFLYKIEKIWDIHYLINSYHIGGKSEVIIWNRNGRKYSKISWTSSVRFKNNLTKYLKENRIKFDGIKLMVRLED